MKRHTRSTTLPIGEVSSGTMREADLIPCFLDMLDDIRLTREERALVREIRRNFDADTEDDANGCMGAEDDLNELFDIAADHCPPYCYFGAHEGDGACYGVWVNHEALAEEVRSCNIAPTREAAGDKHSPYYRACYAYEVNDHGNATLFASTARGWREVWAIV